MPVRFDIPALTVAAYRRLWLERVYVLRLAAIPAAIIFLNAVVVNLALDDVSILRRGLFMIPAMVAEGWVVLQFLRTLLLNERWPMPPPPDLSRGVPPALLRRARDLLSALIFYVLVSLIANGMGGVLANFLPRELAPGTTLPPGQQNLAFIILAVMIVLIAQFRLLWLYIPWVAGGSARAYLAATRPFMINVQILALWMATLLPAFALMILFGPFAALANGADVVAYISYLILTFFTTILQLLMALAVSSAVAMAVMPLLGIKNDGR